MHGLSSLVRLERELELEGHSNPAAHGVPHISTTVPTTQTRRTRITRLPPTTRRNAGHLPRAPRPQPAAAPGPRALLALRRALLSRSSGTSTSTDASTDLDASLSSTDGNSNAKKGKKSNFSTDTTPLFLRRSKAARMADDVVQRGLDAALRPHEQAQCLQLLERVHHIVRALINLTGDARGLMAPMMAWNIDQFIGCPQTLTQVHALLHAQAAAGLWARIVRHTETQGQLAQCAAALQQALDVFGVRFSRFCNSIRISSPPPLCPFPPAIAPPCLLLLRDLFLVRPFHPCRCPRGPLRPTPSCRSAHLAVAPSPTRYSSSVGASSRFSVPLSSPFSAISPSTLPAPPSRPPPSSFQFPSSFPLAVPPRARRACHASASSLRLCRPSPPLFHFRAALMLSLCHPSPPVPSLPAPPCVPRVPSNPIGNLLCSLCTTS
ncbi:hypothetical protein FB451DRAFT_1553671 [Mycena latifolia]|nr:hypothetical protein FB451DRAFT_1553671 [Mycena latifolia]